MHKRESRERRRGHGVADAVSEGPLPLPLANLLYLTVTLFARLRGLSMSHFLASAT